MNSILGCGRCAFLIAALGLTLCVVRAETAKPISPPVPPAPDVIGALDFQGDEIASVLRLLARQAGINIFISDQVTGTITLRLEGKTAKEAIALICKGKGLVLLEQDRDFFVKTLPERSEDEVLRWEAEKRAIYLSTLYKALLEKGVPKETATEVLKNAQIPATPRPLEEFPTSQRAPSQEPEFPIALIIGGIFGGVVAATLGL